MTQAWEGRPQAAGRWPRRGAVWTGLLLVVCLTAGAGAVVYRASTVMTPLQRMYFARYAYSWPGAAAKLKTRVLYAFLATPPSYTRLATDDDLVRTDLVWRLGPYTYGEIYETLRGPIYGGRTPLEVLTDVARPVAWAMLALFGLGLLVTVPKDRARVRSLRTGQPVRGREEVNVGEFNQRTPADGLRIRQGSGIERRW